MIFSKNKRRFLKSAGIVIGISLVVFVLSTQQAHAVVIEWITNNVVTAVLRIIAATLNTLVSILVKLTTELIGVALKFNSSLFSGLNSNIFILTGWGIFRNLANLGFVFGIIVIAIATILRLQSYQARSILWKLIVAALLVNFSLVIVGSFIAVSDIFSNYFGENIAREAGAGSNAAWDRIVSEKLNDSTHYTEVGLANKSTNCDVVYTGGETATVPCASITPSDPSILSSSPHQENNPTDSSGNDLADAISLLIKSIVGIGIMLMLLAISLLLFLRYFYLVFLIIISPIVLLLWIFPHTKEYWTRWWSTLIKWLLFAPINLLFIWLTLSVGNSMDKLVTSAAAGQGPNSSISGIPIKSLVASMISVVLLIAGLKISLSMGLAGSETIMKSATKVGGWARTKATRGVARTGNWLYKPLGALGTGMAKVAGRGGRIGKWTFGAAGRGLIRGGAAIEKRANERFEEAKQEYKKLGKDRAKKIAGTLTGVNKLAMASFLEDNGWLDKKTVKSMGGERGILSMKNLAVRMGKGKDFSELELSVGKTKEILDLQEKVAAGVAGAADDLKKAVKEFADKLKDNDWAKVGRGLFALRREELSDLGPGERTYREYLMQEMARDPSGKRFFKTASQLSGEQLYDFGLGFYASMEPMSNLAAGARNSVDAARQQTDDDIRMTMYTNAAQAVMGHLETYLRTPGGRNDINMKRVRDRLKKSVFGDAIGSAYGGPAPTPGPTPTPGPGSGPGPGPGSAPCLSRNALIDSPSGLIPVRDLRVGMSVWTMDKLGKRVSGVVTKTSKVLVPQTYQMIHLVLDGGRDLFVSPGHPTGDGYIISSLVPGDIYDGSRIVSVARVPYGEGVTHDLLPSGDTGFYWANGILVGSTLHQHWRHLLEGGAKHAPSDLFAY